MAKAKYALCEKTRLQTQVYKHKSLQGCWYYTRDFEYTIFSYMRLYGTYYQSVPFKKEHVRCSVLFAFKLSQAFYVKKIPIKGNYFNLTLK